MVNGITNYVVGGVIGVVVGVGVSFVVMNPSQPEQSTELASVKGELSTVKGELSSVKGELVTTKEELVVAKNIPKSVSEETSKSSSSGTRWSYKNPYKHDAPMKVFYSDSVTGATYGSYFPSGSNARGSTGEVKPCGEPPVTESKLCPGVELVCLTDSDKMVFAWKLDGYCSE